MSAIANVLNNSRGIVDEVPDLAEVLPVRRERPRPASSVRHEPAQHDRRGVRVRGSMNVLCLRPGSNSASSRSCRRSGHEERQLLALVRERHRVGRVERRAGLGDLVGALQRVRSPSGAIGDRKAATVMIGDERQQERARGASPRSRGGRLPSPGVRAPEPADRGRRSRARHCRRAAVIAPHRRSRPSDGPSRNRSSVRTRVMANSSHASVAP